VHRNQDFAATSLEGSMSTSRTKPNHHLSHHGFSSLEAVAALVAGVIGSMVFPVVPFIVGIIAERTTYSAQEIGVVGSADMAGMFVAAMMAAYWIRSSNWRRIAILSAIVLACANLLTFVMGEGFLTLSLARVLAGLGGGSMMALGMAGLAYARNPDRWFGVFVTSQAVLGAFGAWFIPRFLLPLGLGGIALYLAIFAVVAIVPMRWLPRMPPPIRRQEQRVARGSVSLATFSLIAAFIFGGGVFAVWAYLERIGHSAGLSAIAIGDTIASGLLAAMLGAIVATLIGGRFRRVWPITAVFVAQLLAFSILMGNISGADFALGVLLISFLWYFCVPFQVGLTVDLDPTGRFVVLFLMAIKASYAVAPAFVSQFITRNDYSGVLIVGLGSAVLAYAVYVPLALVAPGTKRASGRATAPVSQ
jgi:predicted MFS family arabinose efflux permease